MNGRPYRFRTRRRARPRYPAAIHISAESIAPAMREALTRENFEILAMGDDIARSLVVVQTGRANAPTAD